MVTTRYDYDIGGSHKYRPLYIRSIVDSATQTQRPGWSRRTRNRGLYRYGSIWPGSSLVLYYFYSYTDSHGTVPYSLVRTWSIRVVQIPFHLPNADPLAVVAVAVPFAYPSGVDGTTVLVLLLLSSVEAVACVLGEETTIDKHRHHCYYLVSGVAVGQLKTIPSDRNGPMSTTMFAPFSLPRVDSGIYLPVVVVHVPS